MVWWLTSYDLKNPQLKSEADKADCIAICDNEWNLDKVPASSSGSTESAANPYALQRANAVNMDHVRKGATAGAIAGWRGAWWLDSGWCW